MHLTGLSRIVFPVALTGILSAAEPSVLRLEKFVGEGPSYSFRNGVGLEARFRWPTGIAVDSTGRAYVTDQSATIRRIDTDGTVSTYAGVAGTAGERNGPADQALFSSPRALVMDPLDNLYVADEGTHTIRKITAAGDVTTVAGLENSVGSANGIGAAARFNYPKGLALDSVGNLYVADQANRLIRRIDPDGVVSRFVGPFGRTPEGLEFDLAGNLIVADWQNSNLYRVSPAGVVSSVISIPASGFRDATDVACDKGGNFYITETRGACIRVIRTDGTMETFAGEWGVPGSDDGPPGVARFRGPRGVAFAPDGTLWVADTENNAVRRVSPAGVTTTVAGLPVGSRDGVGTDARVSQVDGMWAGPEGSIWFSDGGNMTIRRAAQDGTVITFAGTPGVEGLDGGTDAEVRFRGPKGLAITEDGSLLVADTYASTIRRRTPEGNWETFAGKPNIGGSADGQGEAARFSSPHEIVLDRDGNLLVADTFNHAIRKVTPDGMVSTWAGGRDREGTNDGFRTDARFLEPRRLALASDGTLFVSDTATKTIRRIAPDGFVTTYAGTTGTSGHADGPALQAKFGNLGGMALDSVGNLYVCDPGNRCIRKVSPDGIVTTVAGKPGVAGAQAGTGGEVRLFYPSTLVVNPEGRLFIADTGANMIWTAVAAGTTPPKLTGQWIGEQFQLTWPTAAGAVLQQSDSLGDAQAWTPVGIEPAVLGDLMTVLLPVGSDARYFRLNLP